MDSGQEEAGAPPVEEAREDPKQQEEGWVAGQEKEVEPENDDNPAAEDDKEEVVITVGDEDPEPEESHAPGWVKEVRTQNRELKRKLRELEALQKTPETSKIDDPGPEPTLEDADFDTDVFSKNYKTWHNKTQSKENAVKKREEADKKSQDDWNATLSKYGQKKNDLKVKGFADSEALVQETLTETQIGIILDGADDPAKVVYAIGKDSKRAKDLASITSPVQFAVAMAKLEASLRTTKRKPAPPPSSLPTGSAVGGGNADKKLDKLYADAAKSGDMSKVRAYRKSMKK